MSKVEIRDHSIINQVMLPETYHITHHIFNQDRYDESILVELEEICNICDTYLWLTNHFPESFTEVDSCVIIKERIGEIIDAVLMKNGHMYTFST